MVDGLECVMLEPYMDLYKDLLDHGLLEVLPNLLTHGLTEAVCRIVRVMARMAVKTA